MENCPKIQMIYFDMKLCNYDSGDIGEKILNYIYVHFQENPDSYHKEVADFLTLRQAAFDASRDFMGCNLLKKYYRQLQFLSNRFPMKAGEECETEISWDHLYNEKEIIQSDIRFELECVLYNIGALHSYLGCLDKRSNDEGIKISCNHFQNAAWAFQMIRDNYSSFGFTEDLNEDIMTFKLNIMLAQAQECVLEKSIIDNRKHTINAKVSAQIVDYYKLALTNCEKSNFQNEFGSRRTKEFKNNCSFKISYYLALSNFYMGLSSSEQNKHGEAVGFMLFAESKLQECSKLKIKEYQETLKYATDVVETKSKSLKKDNDFVYNEKITSSNDLPEIKGVSLVKYLPIDFNNDPEIASNPDIFNRLVSMKAHELSSMYSEEKAKLSRKIFSECEEKDKQLTHFLEALGLNQLHLDDYDYLKLPKQLLECCASITLRPNLIKEEIPNIMKQIVNVSFKSKDLLNDVEELVLKEKQDYKQYKKENNDLEESQSENSSDEDGPSKSKSHKNNNLNRLNKLKIDKNFYLSRKSKLKETLNAYELLTKNFYDANTSNFALREAFENVITKLQILSLPIAELSEKLPVVEEINDEESKQLKEKFVSLIAKVEEMREQRDQLLKRFQRAIQDDDLTKVIASRQNEIGDNQSEIEKFFNEQLNKHEKLIGYLHQNLNAQENILRALTDANAEFTMNRKKISLALESRNVFIDNLVLAYNSINDLFDKARKGIEFFEKFNESLNDLLRNFTDFYDKAKKEHYQRPKGTNNRNNPIKLIANNNGNNFSKNINLNDLNDVGDLSLEEINSIINSNSRINSSIGNLDMKNNSNGNIQNFQVNERPKLKDYLPYMKPNSWGNKPAKDPGNQTNTDIQNFQSVSSANQQFIPQSFGPHNQ